MRKFTVLLISLTILSQLAFAGRYYDSKVGRFLQIDPNAHNYPDLSPYAYCANNPLKNVDPDGKDIWDFVKGVVVAVGQNVNPTYQGTSVGSYSGDRGDYATGRVVGDVVSMVIGGGEMVAGSAGTGTGVAVSTTGVGAVVGVPMAAASAAVVAHGAVTTGVAAANLGADANSMMNENTSNQSGGRSSNDLKPDSKAEGAHTTFKTDANGNVTNHATYEPNSKNPSGFDQKQRTDVTGGSHYDKATGKDVSTPHTHTQEGVRPAKPEELPKQ